MRTLLTGTVLLLGVIAFLSGCEEVAAPKPVSKPPPDERPAQLYTEIGADELLERWTVLPNGAVAEVPNGRRLAAATEGFSGLSQHFTFRDAREYGACVVFTVNYEYTVSPGNAGSEGPQGPQQVGQNGSHRRRSAMPCGSPFPSGITIATAALGFGGRRVIDLVALSEDLSAQSLRLISRFHDRGTLSDHHRVVAELSASG